VYDDLRLRTTFSRDIAAPTLYQLFAGTQVATANRPDLHTGATNVNLVEQTGGNPLLTPEKAATIVAGFVFTPAGCRAFTTSLDYYHIRIQGRDRHHQHGAADTGLRSEQRHLADLQLHHPAQSLQ
jgi:outer membrane receptor protein involved in Fe transport